MASPSVTHCTLNDRGTKQYQKRIKALESGGDSNDPAVREYSKAKLPAHKAAFDGNIPALEGVFISAVKSGGISIADKGISPLHMAIKGNKMDSVKWLLKFTTTSILNRTKDGKTSVHIAIEQGNMECIKILLSADEKGLKAQLATIEDKSGLTCLLLSIQKHQNAMFKYLLNELGPKALTLENSTGVTAAHVAASTGNFEVLRMLANKQKKMLQGKTKDGCTPVYYAAQEGQLEALAYLHETVKCELTDATISEGFQPIHIAAKGDHINILEYLVTECGPEILHKYSTADGSTPLHIAASVGNYEMCRWIVSYDNSGAVLRALDSKKNTPAHNAAESERPDVLKFLLESGANPHLTNKRGNTPYSIAVHSNVPEMVAAVKEYAPAATESFPEPQYESMDKPPPTSLNEPDPVAANDEEREEEVTQQSLSDETTGEPVYSVPDPEVVAQKRSSMMGPPIPEKQLDIEEEEMEEKKEEVKEKKEEIEEKKEEKDGDIKKTPPKRVLKKSSSVLQKWPHLEEKTEEKKDKVPVKMSTSKSVGSIWPPPKENIKKTSVDVPLGGRKKWPPDPRDEVEEKKEEVIEEEEEVIKKEEVPTEEVEVKEEEEEPRKPFVQLRKTIREPKPPATESSNDGDNELKAALLKLKKKKDT